MHCQNKAVRQIAHGLSGMMWNPNLALFCQSEIAIPCKMDWLEVHPIIKQHDFLSPCQFNIENESTVDEINIDVINLTELNIAGYEPKVYRIE